MGEKKNKGNKKIPKLIGKSWVDSAYSSSNPFMNDGDGVQSKVYLNADDNRYNYKGQATYQFSPDNFKGGTVSGEGSMHRGANNPKPMYGALGGVGVEGLGSLTYNAPDVSSLSDGELAAILQLTPKVQAKLSNDFSEGGGSSAEVNAELLKDLMFKAKVGRKGNENTYDASLNYQF